MFFIECLLVVLTKSYCFISKLVNKRLAGLCNGIDNNITREVNIPHRCQIILFTFMFVQPLAIIRVICYVNIVTSIIANVV